MVGDAKMFANVFIELSAVNRLLRARVNAAPLVASANHGEMTFKGRRTSRWH